jgi:hypothetical protein
MTDAKDKNIYNVNLSDKIRKSVASAKEFKLDLDSNITDIKRKASELSRKEINLNFIDRFTRKIYTNEFHLAKLEMLQYIMFIVLIYYYNPFDISTTFPAFTKLLVLTVSFLYVILFIFIRAKVSSAEDVDLINPTESNIIIEFIATILMFVAFMLLIKGIIWILIHTSLINVIHHMMTLFIIVGVLGIVYLFMKNTINKAKNAPGRKFTTLVLKFIMFLPCLLVDFVEYVKYEFNLTTKPVWILMGVEGLLVALVFLLPILFDKALSYDGLKLLNAPVNLNIEQTIGVYDQLYKHTKNDKREKTPKADDYKEDENIFDQTQTPEYTDPNMPKNQYLAWIYKKLKNPSWLKLNFKVHPQYTDTGLQKFRYTYALSGWFNINPQPPNTNSAYGKYTNILNYGKKVSLEYNGKKNSLRVMAAVAADSSDVANKNQLVQVYETKNIIYQKWNNIVINYDEGFIDVFLNGDLVGSISGVAPYMEFDSIKTGANGGIYGGICNVAYYESVLSKRTIILNYKALRSKDEPYIWRISDDVNVNIKRNKNSNNRLINDIKNKF